jgi:hypothetical protein
VESEANTGKVRHLYMNNTSINGQICPRHVVTNFNAELVDGSPYTTIESTHLGFIGNMIGGTNAWANQTFNMLVCPADRDDDLFTSF